MNITTPLRAQCFIKAPHQLVMRRDAQRAEPVAKHAARVASFTYYVGIILNEISILYLVNCMNTMFNFH